MILLQNASRYFTTGVLVTLSLFLPFVTHHPSLILLKPVIPLVPLTPHLGLQTDFFKRHLTCLSPSAHHASSGSTPTPTLFQEAENEKQKE